MLHISDISLTEDVSLGVLKNVNSNLAAIAGIFDIIAEEHINLDMISQSNLQGDRVDLSFTFDNSYIDRFFRVVKKLKTIDPEVKPILNGSNSKIVFAGVDFSSQIGVASHILHTLQDLNLEVMLITTAINEVSILVSDVNIQEKFEIVKHSYLK